jgi:CRP-like cAMP-binding protein
MVLPDELQDVELFQDIPPAYVTRIALLAGLKEYPPESVIFREGEQSPCVYFVLRGDVSLEVAVAGRGPVPVATVGPGKLLGWSSVLGLGPMTATARCTGWCRLAVLRADQVLGLCDDDPKFGMAFMRRMAVALANRLAASHRHLSARG